MKKENEKFSGINFTKYADMDEVLHDLFMDCQNNYKVVITPNVDHIVRVRSNFKLRHIYNDAEICINDSRVLQILTRLIGVDLGAVITGSSLTKEIIERISGTETPITVIGTSNESINVITEKYELRKLFHYNPPMGFIDDRNEVIKCIDFVEKHPSDFIFLAVGSPRQEILANELRKRKIHGNALCIGASMLFLSGEEKRAPLIIQKLSLEWLFRLIQSPRRLFKRYLLDGMQIFPILLEEHQHRKRKDA